MSGSKKTLKTRKEILEAMKSPPPGGYFVWDGKDEDERPLTKKEMSDGIAAYRRSRGRPSGATKEQVAIRFDKDVRAALRATGKGWQSRINDIVREWVRTRPGT
jgi:uncharacterized protein (DUF4415 family)